MFFDNMSDKQKKMLLGVVVFLGIYLMTDLLNCLDPVLGWFKSFVFQLFGKSGFDLGDFGSSNQVAASEPLGQNEGQLAVQGLGRTPSTCYPQQTLKPEDLLPTDESKAIQEFNNAKPVGEGILQGVNLLDAGDHVGVNTDQQLRSEPPNPQVSVSPWLNTTIGPDLARKPLELNESCGTELKTE